MKKAVAAVALGVVPGIVLAPIVLVGGFIVAFISD